MAFYGSLTIQILECRLKRTRKWKIFDKVPIVEVSTGFSTFVTHRGDKFRDSHSWEGHVFFPNSQKGSVVDIKVRDSTIWNHHQVLGETSFSVDDSGREIKDREMTLRLLGTKRQDHKGDLVIKYSWKPSRGLQEQRPLELAKGRRFQTCGSLKAVSESFGKTRPQKATFSSSVLN